MRIRPYIAWGCATSVVEIVIIESNQFVCAFSAHIVTVRISADANSKLWPHIFHLFLLHRMFCIRFVSVSHWIIYMRYTIRIHVRVCTHNCLDQMRWICDFVEFTFLSYVIEAFNRIRCMRPERAVTDTMSTKKNICLSHVTWNKNANKLFPPIAGFLNNSMCAVCQRTTIRA